MRRFVCLGAWVFGFVVVLAAGAGCGSKPGAGEAPKEFKEMPKERPGGGTMTGKPVPGGGPAPTKESVPVKAE